MRASRSGIHGSSLDLSRAANVKSDAAQRPNLDARNVPLRLNSHGDMVGDHRFPQLKSRHNGESETSESAFLGRGR